MASAAGECKVEPQVPRTSRGEWARSSIAAWVARHPVRRSDRLAVEWASLLKRLLGMAGLKEAVHFKGAPCYRRKPADEAGFRQLSDAFFEQSILNSPYEMPSRHWELDESGQPTQEILERRRRADFITPIPKPGKKKGAQEELVYDEGKGLSSQDQQYDLTAIINEVRGHVDRWRELRRTNGS